MRLFDTASQRYVAYEPSGAATLYTCGITPYDSAHLGHIFTFLTYDLLQRRLEDKGHEVKLVRNITDVDDPIYRKAAELKVPYDELAARETGLFRSVLTRLNFRPTYAEPLASQYIQPMAEAVRQLIDGGYGYQLEQDIYFDTSKDKAFGTFSGYGPKLHTAFMHRRGGDPSRPGKRNPLDFKLWHGVSDSADPAAWDTVLGRGRPGWHIECSVMASQILGTPFDIHGGGDDLIFPHHECEIAQSKALGQPLLARHWLHVAPILYAGDKMSKSIGNLVFAKDLLEHHSPEVIRLSMLNYHYRTGGEWQPEFLEEATALFTAIEAKAASCSAAAAEDLLAEIRNALDNDIDTHQIMHALADFAACEESSTASPTDQQAIKTVYRLLGFTN